MSGLADLAILLELRRRREQRAAELSARSRAAVAQAETVADEAAEAVAAHDRQLLASRRARHHVLVSQMFSPAALERLRQDAMIAGAVRRDLASAEAEAAAALALQQRERAAAQAAHRERQNDRLRLELACTEQAKRERRRRAAYREAALDESTAAARPAR